MSKNMGRKNIQQDQHDDLSETLSHKSEIRPINMYVKISARCHVIEAPNEVTCELGMGISLIVAYDSQVACLALRGRKRCKTREARAQLPLNKRWHV